MCGLSRDRRSRGVGPPHEARTDVTTINSAIDIYVANGGDLTGLSCPQMILDKLKTRRAQESAMRYAGFRHDMLDRRVAARLQTEQEAAGGNPRAIWNAASLQFEISNAGAGGVAEFILDDTLGVQQYALEERAPSAVDFKHGQWMDLELHGRERRQRQAEPHRGESPQAPGNFASSIIPGA